MPTARGYPAAATAGGKIFAVGGISVSYTDINEEYDPGVASQFTRLTPNTLYTFKAKARDSAGNETTELTGISTTPWPLSPAPSGS